MRPRATRDPFRHAPRPRATYLGTFAQECRVNAPPGPRQPAKYSFEVKFGRGALFEKVPRLAVEPNLAFVLLFEVFICVENGKIRVTCAFVQSVVSCVPFDMFLPWGLSERLFMVCVTHCGTFGQSNGSARPM